MGSYFIDYNNRSLVYLSLEKVIIIDKRILSVTLIGFLKSFGFNLTKYIEPSKSLSFTSDCALEGNHEADMT